MIFTKLVFEIITINTRLRKMQEGNNGNITKYSETGGLQLACKKEENVRITITIEIGILMKMD